MGKKLTHIDDVKDGSSVSVTLMRLKEKLSKVEAQRTKECFAKNLS